MPVSLFDEFPFLSTEDWLAKVRKDLKGKDPERLTWHLAEGFDMFPIQRMESLSENTPIQHAWPGVSPFLRGNSPLGASQSTWVIGQEVPYQGKSEKMPAYLERLANEISNAPDNGVHSLLIDLGLLPLNQLISLLSDFDPGSLALNFINSKTHCTPSDILNKIGESNDLYLKEISGSLERNPLLGLLETSGQEIDMGEWLQEYSDLKTSFPGLKLLNIDLAAFVEKGGTLVHQMAFGLSLAMEYLDAATEHGIEAQEFFGKLMFTFPIGTAFFPEIAKFRAFRLLLGQLMAGYGINNGDPVFVQGKTSTWEFGTYDGYTNLLRSTTEAMAAVMGGTDSVIVSHFDHLKVEKDQTSNAATLARNIQLILRDEAYLGKVVDPGGGSYYLETLTEKLAEKAWKLFLETEAKGGFIAACKQGWITQQLDQALLKQKTKIEERSEVLIGINQFPDAVVRTEKLPGFQFAGANFEALRIKGEKLKTQIGEKFSAAIFSFGNVRMRNARAEFAGNLLGLVGLNLQENPAPNDSELSLTWLKGKQSGLIILCSSDEEYLSRGINLISQIQLNCPDSILIVAGKPDREGKLEEAGINHFIYAKQNAVDFLNSMLKTLSPAT